jgi:hypothetical protein
MARKSSSILTPHAADPVPPKPAKPPKPLSPAKILKDAQSILKQFRIDVITARKVLAEAEMKAAKQEQYVKRLELKAVKAKTDDAA